MFTACGLNGEDKEIDGVCIASWSPGNTNVVIVDPNGVVTGVAEGAATVTATVTAADSN